MTGYNRFATQVIKGAEEKWKKLIGFKLLGFIFGVALGLYSLIHHNHTFLGGIYSIICIVLGFSNLYQFVSLVREYDDNL